MARTYGIDGKRGNMVVRQFLEKKNVDLTRFDNPYINKQRVRRCNLKMPGIEKGISVLNWYEVILNLNSVNFTRKSCRLN